MNELRIRADASAQIGAGHVMRCLGLAEHWMEKGGRVTFYSDCPAASLQDRVRASGAAFQSVDSRDPDAGLGPVLQDAGAADPTCVFVPWVVLDGYQFDDATQTRVTRAGFHLLCIDDVAQAPHYHAALVMNQNSGVSDALYPNRDPTTELLLGTRYAILRGEFRRERGVVRDVARPVRHALVTFGGADPDNFTARVLAACAAFPELELRVVAGAANRHVASLREQIQRLGLSAELCVSVGDMPSLMRWADVAISAAGQTCWEMARMGLPAIVVAIADNQVQNAEGLQRDGVALNLGRREEQTPDRIAAVLRSFLADAEGRARMARRGQALIDGRGVERIVERMRRRQVSFRPARAEDCRWVWELANDPIVRQASFQDATISWETHTAWFQRRLEDRIGRFLVVESDKGLPIGQVRLDEDGEALSISISLVPGVRGGGWGAVVIRRACGQVAGEAAGRVIRAGIRAENVASVRAFETAGFRRTGEGTVQGRAALFMEWKGPDEDI